MRPECPEVEPSAGAACGRADLSCGYGDSPSAECRRLYVCDGVWTVPPSKEQWPCDDLPADFCPGAMPSNRAPCEAALPGSAQPCAYDEVRCYCGPPNAPPSIPHVWICFAPPQNPDCPVELPNVGEGCDAQGTLCHYGLSCYGPRENYLRCNDEAWQANSPGSCFH